MSCCFNCRSSQISPWHLKRHLKRCSSGVYARTQNMHVHTCLYKHAPSQPSTLPLCTAASLHLSLSLHAHLSIASSDLIWGLWLFRGNLVVSWLAWRPSPLRTDLYTLPDTGPDPSTFTRSTATQMSECNAAKLLPSNILFLTTSVPKVSLRVFVFLPVLSFISTFGEM